MYSWLCTIGREELQVVLSKDQFPITRALVPLEEKIPVLFENSPLPQRAEIHPSQDLQKSM